jgi:TetR/AcrR family transcriptional regulator, transcriptional repressor for nem operon
LGSLASGPAENDSVATQDIVVAYRRWQGAIRAELAAMPDRGKLVENTERQHPGPTLLTTLQGGLLLSKTLRDGRPLEQALNTVIDHIATFAGSTRPRYIPELQ